MIKLFVMDVDGTLTDGGIYYDNQGHEFKKFNVKDGAGIRMLHAAGIKTMILTGRASECVKRRSQELGITFLGQGLSDKATYLKEFMQEHQLDTSEVAYIGDDINDIECMAMAGYTACPWDANTKIKSIVHAICECGGGQGAVREFVDYIFEEFLYLQPLMDEEGAWYTETHLRAHAGGGIDGFMYTNSMEA